MSEVNLFDLLNYDLIHILMYQLDRGSLFQLESWNIQIDYKYLFYQLNSELKGKQYSKYDEHMYPGIEDVIMDSLLDIDIIVPYDSNPPPSEYLKIQTEKQCYRFVYALLLDKDNFINCMIEFQILRNYDKVLYNLLIKNKKIFPSNGIIYFENYKYYFKYLSAYSYMGDEIKFWFISNIFAFENINEIISHIKHKITLPALSGVLASDIYSISRNNNNYRQFFISIIQDFKLDVHSGFIEYMIDVSEFNIALEVIKILIHDNNLEVLKDTFKYFCKKLPGEEYSSIYFDKFLIFIDNVEILLIDNNIEDSQLTKLLLDCKRLIRHTIYVAEDVY
jgi:hypothetical protein